MNQFQRWITGWSLLFDGCVSILTLGFCYPFVTLKVAKYFIKTNSKKVKL
jgi:hypothetical protein